MKNNPFQNQIILNLFIKMVLLLCDLFH